MIGNFGGIIPLYPLENAPEGWYSLKPLLKSAINVSKWENLTKP